MRPAAFACAAALFVAACVTAPAPPAGSQIEAAFDCVRERGTTLISAHRGGPQSGLPENALETFAASVAAGVWLLEVDVRRTADGALVLMHDDTLERTTNGAGLMSAISLMGFSELRLKDNDGALTGFAPPTLEAALDWAAGRAVLQLDVKRGVALRDVAEAVRKAGAEDRVVLIVYTLADAALAARVAPEMMISASIDAPSDLADLSAAGVDPRRVLAWTGTRTPDPALWASLRERGVEPMFGTLGGADSLDRRFAAEGRDQAYADLSRNGLAVIGTDRPRQALAAVGAAGAECFTGIIGRQ